MVQENLCEYYFANHVQVIQSVRLHTLLFAVTAAVVSSDVPEHKLAQMDGYRLFLTTVGYQYTHTHTHTHTHTQARTGTGNHLEGFAVYCSKITATHHHHWQQQLPSVIDSS